MLIDFESVHQRYLVGSNTDGVWQYEPVNPRSPRAGKHLSSYQVFSNAGLGVALYLRNDFEGELATKVHVGLKLIFSRKVRESFLLQKDDQKISLTLDMGGVRALYAWLAGETPAFTYEIVRPDAPKKQITGFETDLAFPLSIRASESDAFGTGRSITVGLADADIFHLQLHCLGLAKLLYPSLSDTALLAHLKPRVSAKQQIHAPLQPPSANDEPPQAPEVAPEQRYISDASVGSPASHVDPERSKRAVFAVGKTRWPRKDIATIEHIQQGPVEAMDRFVKAGNAGDFTEWDRIYNLLNPGSR
ncbi:hypothetical protein H8F21_15435 [Pseudomonas sp. P66]|uniref:Tle cognate immunity protein 4 C-terminal domain-containing protein n=1 Tax=Pseudomonas arcuscaelestis TaxID=2710591 RepID=A0ABS2C1L8_9PSED|nr:hypothetical protein [Pseudomonas arcuscaelestis]MBM5458959.1 hypothetical protein [Pseudomonas arcuscaelestis]